MKRIFTLLFSAIAITGAMAQSPAGVFAKATTAPVIDGVVDAVWSEATVYNIDKPVVIAGVATPLTLGAPGETTWQGLWTKDGVFILVQVADNAFYPNYVAGPGLNDYDYDKIELYFDVNYSLVGDLPLGPSASGSGHYQVAPGYKLDQNDGTAFTTDGVINAFMVSGSHTVAEYFVPFSKLLDFEKIQVDKTNTIGFDVTINDRDPGDLVRNSAVWSNDNIGNVGENWANMDNCGKVTFADATANVMAETIVVANTDLTITTDKGTLQMVANIGPEEATIKIANWTLVGGTAQASISSNGLISAVSNGTIIVKASTTDGSFLNTDEITVTITGQKRVVYTEDVWNVNNLIRNWNFDNGVTEWGGWVDEAVLGQLAPVIEGGVCVMKVGKSSAGEGYHYQHNQINVGAEANVEYTVKFKSWASATADCILDFESASDITPTAGGDQYARYGTDTDTNTASEWRYTTSKIPSWYTFHVKFDKMIETTVQKIQWMNSLSDETIYLDSVLLVKTEELAIVSGAKTTANSINRVYPSPVGDSNNLFVELSSVNAKVAIYNAVGQKMMEKVATGNIAKFDVSNLRKGLYFVKLGDGSIQKFIR